MKNVDLTKIHYLSGPFEIEDAEPGDVLIVDICDVRLFTQAVLYIDLFGYRSNHIKSNLGDCKYSISPSGQLWLTKHQHRLVAMIQAFGS